MRHLVGIACLLAQSFVLSLGGPGAAADEAGLTLADIRSGAEANDPAAMVGYAMLLLDGTAVEYDAAQAATLITAAADTGNRQAGLMLSVLLEEGLGMERDPDRAARLLQELADSGLPEALYRRAQLRAESDPEAATIDLQMAAAQGHVPALQVLATLRNWDEMTTELDALATNPAAMSAPPPEIADINVIIAIQAMLLQLGHDPGLPTWQPTPETRAAIAAYQADQGLVVDGIPTVALRDHIAKVLREDNQ